MGLKTVIGMGEGHFVLFREFDSFDACELKGQNRIQPFGSTYVKEFNHRVMGLIFINYQCGPTKKTNKKTSPVPEIFEFLRLPVSSFLLYFYQLTLASWNITFVGTQIFL